MKRSPLRRRTGLRSRPKQINRNDPARQAWKTSVAGYCQCGCDRFSLHLHRHHVLLEQIVEREHGDVYDLANSMLLHPHCHANHHSAARKVPIESVPAAAVLFAVGLLGEAAAADYFDRRYGCQREERQAA